MQILLCYENNQGLVPPIVNLNIWADLNRQKLQLEAATSVWEDWLPKYLLQIGLKKKQSKTLARCATYLVNKGLFMYFVLYQIYLLTTCFVNCIYTADLSIYPYTLIFQRFATFHYAFVTWSLATMLCHIITFSLVISDVGLRFRLAIKPFFHKLILVLPYESRCTGSQFLGTFTVRTMSIQIIFLWESHRFQLWHL